MTAALDDASKVMMWGNLSPHMRWLYYKAFGMTHDDINAYRNSVGMKPMPWLTLDGESVDSNSGPAYDLTPAQIANLEAAMDAMASDPAWEHKIIKLPPGRAIRSW